MFQALRSSSNWDGPHPTITQDSQLQESHLLKIPNDSSVQCSCSVVSESLWPHEQQHARPPCLSPTPRVHPNPYPLSGDTIQLSRPLSSPSPPALNPSQHQGLFKWVSSSHQVAKVLQSFHFNISPSSEHPGLISFRMDWLDLLASKRLSRVFSNTTVQKHQFFGAQLSL